MLLSLLPPSCIVVPIRDLVNKKFLSFTNLHTNQSMSSTNHQMDINTEKNKERSLNSSPNSSRDLSIYSDASSIEYAERIKA